MPNPTRVTVAILSDTHAHLDDRIAVLVSACDYAVHAGDIMGAHVLAALQPRQRVIAVAGNNDIPERWADVEGHIVRQLPHVAELDLPGGLLVVEHGHRHGHDIPSHESLRRTHGHARAIVYGHSHKLICDQNEEPWVINPGAAGRTRTHGGPSCLILSASTEAWTLAIKRYPT